MIYSALSLTYLAFLKSHSRIYQRLDRIGQLSLIGNFRQIIIAGYVSNLTEYGIAGISLLIYNDTVKQVA